MLPPTPKKEKKSHLLKLYNSWSLLGSHGSIEEKTKKPKKMSQYRPKKKTKIQYHWKSDESTLILDFK